MASLDPVFDKLDQMIIRSRLSGLALMYSSDRTDRIVRMAQVILKLPAGAYLLGTGPSTVGIIPLTVEEVVLGRPATPVEEPSATVIDYAVPDTLYFAPYEVSRTHAKVVRTNDPSGPSFSVIDLGSTCGTFVNGIQIESDGYAEYLSHGDILSLGPSQISTYLFYVAVPSE